MRVCPAPRGERPVRDHDDPVGDVYYASLAGSYLGRIDLRTGEATVLEPPTPGQGARRAWSDSRGRIWISEWNAGKVGMYDPKAGAGASGSSRARTRWPTRSTSTSATRSGSPTSGRTRSCASTR